MNILKATIATAAVITCCLGNEMPAKANSKASQDYVNQLRAMGMQPKTPRPFRLCG